MPTIYRQYRPQKFSSISGQNHIVQTIANEIATNKIAQAYLFFGPRGVGKTTIARLLAKSVNCTNRQPGTFEPCDECSSCTEITAGRNIDVIEIDAASHTGVDNVRENIIDNAQFKPTKSPFKVFIIDEVHMLSTSAFNALLKTLEEPPAHIIFVLATTEMHKLPATIISRCQRFTFKKIAHDEMLNRLNQIAETEQIKIDKDVMEKIIHKSDGCLRDAESLLGQIMSLNLKTITAEDIKALLPTSSAGTIINFIEYLVEKKSAPALDLISNLAENGINLDQFALDLIQTLRDLMILQAGSQNDNLIEYDEATQKTLKKLSQTLTPTQLVKLIDLTLARRIEIRQSPLPQLPLELLVVNFTGDTSENIQTPPSTPTPIATSSTIPTITTSTPSDATIKTTTHKITDTIKSAISNITHKTLTTKTLEEISAKWPDVCTKLTSCNPSLVFILKMCQLEKVDIDGLHISSAYKFHQEKIEEIKTKKIVEGCIAEILGEKINLVCELKAGEPETKPNETTDLTTLAAEFGGEVVE
ncbi:MAG: polymerase III, subunit gamma and tau protein [Candidatus Magasanikbacteria bacterium GW2011_GWA2_37_8]|uniref:DNA polymerase III subunit gamma/tau n=1 Tax=Candidatus Magasanikbacteria bacterium GW2011_GWA2_37_8 TaxID=1619036 RepID=A0A0G0HGI4_9BACT|nr:MAG: polymerase III, subunit gamma and tau protein [Candidatus Magasanikbacteria bacterium GW2011_GWA2_37_8]